MSTAKEADKVAQRIQRLETFLNNAPEDTFTRFALALEYLKADRTTDAEYIFADIAKKQPDYSGVYYHLGKLYEQQERYEEAFATYSTGIDICGQQQELHARQELQQAQMALRNYLDEEEEDE